PGDQAAQSWCALSPRPFSWTDHLICAQQQGLRNHQAEGLGGLEVDDQLETAGLLHGEIGRLRTLEDLVGVRGRPSGHIGIARALSHEPSVLYEFRIREHSRQPALRAEGDDLRSVSQQEAVRDDDERVWTLLRDEGEGIAELLRLLHVGEL